MDSATAIAYVITGTDGVQNIVTNKQGMYPV